MSGVATYDSVPMECEPVWWCMAACYWEYMSGRVPVSRCFYMVLSITVRVSLVWGRSPCHMAMSLGISGYICGCYCVHESVGVSGVVSPKTGSLCQ